MIEKRSVSTYGPEISVFDIDIDREREGIISDIVELKDNKRLPGPYSIKKLMTDTPIMVVSGEPDNGKSWFLEQMGSALKTNTVKRNKKIVERNLFYEDFLKKAEKDWGPREFWDVDRQWYEMNTAIVEKTQEAVENSNGIVVTKLELPAVGLVDKRDVGVTALDRLVRGSVDSKNIIFVFITHNPLVAIQSALLRDAVAKLDPSQVLDKLEQYNMFVEGDFDRTRMGSLVKKMFSRSAKFDQMMRIRREEEQKIHGWAVEKMQTLFDQALVLDPDVSRNPNDYDLRNLRKSKFNIPNDLSEEKISRIYRSFDIEVPDSFLSLLCKNLQNSTVDQAVYMDDFFTSRGLSEENFLILFNPYKEEKKIIGSDFIKLRSE